MGLLGLAGLAMSVMLAGYFSGRSRIIAAVTVVLALLSAGYLYRRRTRQPIADVAPTDWAAAVSLRLSAAPRKGAKALPLGKMGKKQIGDLTAHVAKSTASIGKFNAPIPGDERIKTRGKRRQFDPVTDAAAERAKAAGFVDKLVRREKDFEVDVNLAARKIQRAKEAESRDAKKAKLAAKAEGADKRSQGKKGKGMAGMKAKSGTNKKK